jgi:hypothetical protein
MKEVTKTGGTYHREPFQKGMVTHRDWAPAAIQDDGVTIWCRWGLPFRQGGPAMISPAAPAIVMSWNEPRAKP